MNQMLLFRQTRIRDKETGEVPVMEGGDISHCSNPIAPLLKSIASCVGQIAPERHDDLRVLIASGISIELDVDREDFYPSVGPRKIVVWTWLPLSSIWAYNK